MMKSFVLCLRAAAELFYRYMLHMILFCFKRNQLCDSFHKNYSMNFKIPYTHWTLKA